MSLLEEVLIIFTFLRNKNITSQVVTSVTKCYMRGSKIDKEASHIVFKTILFNFQLDDTTTVFLGGSNNPFGIISYDWKTNTYTQHSGLLANLSLGQISSIRSGIYGKRLKNFFFIQSQLLEN
jgi:hypothetical protein